MKWIRAQDLELWAQSKLDARAELSDVVSQLVRASVSDIQSYRFPTGDSAQIAGYDGILETAAAVAPFVPAGKSVWEFGVAADFLKKANDDYRDRTKNPRDADPPQTTFVFVTPRIWDAPKKTIGEWRKEHLKEKIWKDVAILDAVQLEAWFDRCPAVAARFAREVLGLIPQIGARSTVEFWEEYVSRFKPALVAGVLLCERGEQARTLVEQLGARRSEIIWRADSPDEVIAFTAAAIRSSDSEIRKHLESRTLIVDIEDAARQLSAYQDLILIPRGTALNLAGLLSKRNSVVVPLGRESTRRDAGVLSRPSTHALGEALEQMGFRSPNAYQLARECGRSVTILARRIPNGDAGWPIWADGKRTLIPAMIAGGWNALSQNDQEVLKRLANVESYEQYERELKPYLTMRDPPLDREGAVWKVRAPVDAFIHLAYLIDQQDLNELRTIALEVFGDIDPLVDAPVDDKPVLRTRENSLKHSEWLREGLATTLLQIAVLHKEANFSVPGIDPEHYVEEIVRNIPQIDRDYRVSASMRNELMLLMEAAPNPLLETLERQLEGNQNLLRPIFRKDGLFTSSLHTHLLWALEILAWDPQFLSRVALILARLARIDPGGNTQNRPINSLKEIFLPWHPNTNASVEQRINALDYIVSHEPDAAWDLVTLLLPDSMGYGSNNPRPVYREAKGPGEVLTYGLLRKNYEEFISRALDLAGARPDRWARLLKSLTRIEDARMRGRFYDALDEAVTQMSSEQRSALWPALRDEVGRNQSFPDAKWSLKSPEIDRLERLSDELGPQDLLDRVKWLFDDHYPQVASRHTVGVPDPVESARKDAIRQVIQQNGYDSVLVLASDVKCPEEVGIATALTVDNVEPLLPLLQKAIQQNRALGTFARLLSGVAHRRFGEPWAKLILSHRSEWNSDQLAEILLAWNDVRTTWDLVSKLGLDQQYWSRKPIWPISAGAADLEFAALKLLGVKRATAALKMIWTRSDELPAELILALLDTAVREINESNITVDHSLAFDIDHIFGKLATRSDVRLEEIARREYAYLPLLDYREGRLTLHKILASDAGFFMTIICDAFRPKSAKAPETAGPPEALSRAKAGYRLLSSFNTIPGEQDGKIDQQQLWKWVEQVRALASKEDRAEIADQFIGKALAYSPNGADGQWPHEIVRDLIENLKSEHLEIGLIIERQNMRGVVNKAIFEGGEQERALAGQSQAWSDAMAKWPRTSAMLRRLAKQWEHDAQYEDERAHQDQMRY